MDVRYKGCRLHKNSQAYQLWLLAQKPDGSYKALDEHMKQLDRNEKELLARYK